VQLGVLTVMEDFADGAAGNPERRAAALAAEQRGTLCFSIAGEASRAVSYTTFVNIAVERPTPGRAPRASEAAQFAAVAAALHAVSFTPETPAIDLNYDPAWHAALHREWKEQSTLVRDTFSLDPFHLPTLPRSVLDWKGGLIRSLAEAAYQERSLPS